MKNKKALILLLIANIISGIAQGISMLAIPWFFAREGQLHMFIWFFIITNLFGLFWVPYAGTLIDKYSRKHVFLLTNLISGLILAIVCLIGFSQGDLSLPMVASVFVLTFLNYSIHYPNLYAFVQEITDREYYGKITSILEIQGQATNILAGVVAVLLLEGSKDGFVEILGFKMNVFAIFESWKIHEIILIDCLTYFVAFAVISMITFVAIGERKEENASLIERLKTGFTFLKNNRTTFLFGVVSYFIFVAVLIEGFYLGASYVSKHLEAAGDVYASSDIAYATGAIISGIFIRTIFRRVNIPLGIIILALLTSALFFVLFATKSQTIFYFMLFVLGVTNAGSRIMRVTYLFNNIPNQVFGRAASIFNICNILVRVSLLLLFSLSFFDQGNNVIYAFLTISVFLLLTVIILIVNYRKFDLKIY